MFCFRLEQPLTAVFFPSVALEDVITYIEALTEFTQNTLDDIKEACPH